MRSGPRNKQTAENMSLKRQAYKMAVILNPMHIILVGVKFQSKKVYKKILIEVPELH